MTVCQLTSCKACKNCGQFKVTYSPYLDVKPSNNDSAVSVYKTYRNLKFC